MKLIVEVPEKLSPSLKSFIDSSLYKELECKKVNKLLMTQEMGISLEEAISVVEVPNGDVHFVTARGIEIAPIDGQNLNSAARVIRSTLLSSLLGLFPDEVTEVDLHVALFSEEDTAAYDLGPKTFNLAAEARRIDKQDNSGIGK